MMSNLGSGPNDPDFPASRNKLKKQDTLADLKTADQSMQDLILSTMEEKIVFHSSKMKIRWANQAACSFYELPLEKLIGHTCHILLKRSKDACRGCPVKKVMKTGEFHQDILSFPDKKTMLISAYPVYESTKLSGIIEVTLDITERTRFEEELRRTKDESVAASEAKSRFLANISHDIRTQMNVIQGMANLVYESASSGEHKEYLNMIRESSSFLLQLVNDLLDISKIESGKFELNKESFNLYREVGKAVSAFTLQAQKKNLRLYCSIDDNVPGDVIGDPAKLQRILMNLIGNGVKFTAKGEVAVLLKLSDDDIKSPAIENGKSKEEIINVRFEVRDTGIGISAEKLDKIFQEFAQVGPRRVGIEWEGTGLGLSISKNLIEMMGGSISIESKVNKGSIFYFTLPFALPEKTIEIEGKVFPDSISSLSAVEVPERKKLDILLVEDKTLNQKFMTILLEKKGHRVLSVKNGKDALTVLKIRKFDLVLMDVQMPDMDGLEATMLIREAEQKSGLRIPIVAMTAHAMKEDRDKFLQKGMDYYISKPIDQDELYKILDQIIQKINKPVE